MTLELLWMDGAACWLTDLKPASAKGNFCCSIALHWNKSESLNCSTADGGCFPRSACPTFTARILGFMWRKRLPYGRWQRNVRWVLSSVWTVNGKVAYGPVSASCGFCSIAQKQPNLNVLLKATQSIYKLCLDSWLWSLLVVVFWFFLIYQNDSVKTTFQECCPSFLLFLSLFFRPSCALLPISKCRCFGGQRKHYRT